GQVPSVVVGRAAPTQPIDAVCRYVKKDLRPLLPGRFQAMFEGHTTQVVNEALCLLYVAMTRAMQALYLVIPPSRPQEKSLPKTLAGLVRAALCGEATAPPDAVVYEHGMPDWQQRQTPPTALDGPPVALEDVAEPAQVTIQLRPSVARRGRGL